MGLTSKQQLFCEAYLSNGFNGTQAAITAGYSEETAAVIASENLRKPYIEEYIEERQKQVAARLQINQDRVLRELSRIAFSDIRKFYNVDGALRSVHEMDEESAAALAGVESYDTFVEGESIGQTKKIKTYDKLKALEGISKMLGYNAPEKFEGKFSAFDATNMTPERIKEISKALEDEV